MHICEAWAHHSPESLLEKHHQCRRGILCLRWKRLYLSSVTPSWASSQPPSPPPPLTSASLSTGSVLSLSKNRCCWLEVSSQDEGFCLHVFSVWNAAFASTRSGLGGTQQIFLVRPGTPDQTTTTTHARSAVSGHSTVELNPTVGLLLLSYLHKWLKFGWNENAINHFALMISAHGLNGAHFRKVATKLFKWN